MNDWREYRPAIWATMFGIAVIVVVSPHYLGAFLIGGAIGIAIRIRQRQRARQRQAAGSGFAGLTCWGLACWGLACWGLACWGLTWWGRAETRPWETAIPVISTAAPTG